MLCSRACSADIQWEYYEHHGKAPYLFVLMLQQDGALASEDVMCPSLKGGDAPVVHVALGRVFLQSPASNERVTSLLLTH